MIFAFEGIDGSGKSTVLQAVAQKFKQRTKLEPVLRAEPSKEGMGAEIRVLVQTGQIRDIPISQVLRMFSEDRINTLSTLGSQTDQGWVMDHPVILSDRCFLSTMAYQAAQFPDDREEVRRSQEQFFDLPIKHYWFRLDVKKAVARCAVRAKDGNKAWDRDPEFIQRVHDEYADLFMLKKHRIMCLDASRPVGELAETIFQDIIHMTQ